MRLAVMKRNTALPFGFPSPRRIFLFGFTHQFISRASFRPTAHPLIIQRVEVA
jgi:hypothetical protein